MNLTKYTELIETIFCIRTLLEIIDSYSYQLSDRNPYSDKGIHGYNYGSILINIVTLICLKVSFLIWC